MNKFRISIGRKYKNVPNKKNRANNVMRQPGWERSLGGGWEGTDTCICTAEFLCCLPETITTSLIGDNPTLGAQLVRNPPAMRETWVRSLGGEDPLENGKAIHYSNLDWRIPWTV